MAKLTSSLVISLNDRVSGPARGIMGTLGRLKHSADGFNRNQTAMTSGLMSNLKGLLAAAAAYVSLTEGISSTIGAAIKFEDSMSDIRKVVDFKSPQQFKQMGDDILKMSSQLGMSTSSIADIVAAWGQANAKTDELLALTEMTAKVAIAWDTTAAETGDALAKIRTALGLTVEQTGLVADAINFLGNASASGTKDLLKFSRGLNSGKLAGFAAKETLAFGAAMISSGFEAEVAETSFRNMAFALTSGSKATKEQRSAFKRLGFDAKKVSKAMQKDAVGTTLAVLDAISALPKDEQGAIAASLFGKEARAVPALLGNLPELRRLLGLVAEDAKYAGSAQREFDEAMKRTSVNLARLKQSVAGIGVAIGNLALPTINEWATELSTVLNTLDQRVGVFDRMGQGIKGFMSGLGFEGMSAKDGFKSLVETVFGQTTDLRGKSVELFQVFSQFREYGASVRAFGSAIGESIGDIEKFFHLDAGTIGETMGQIGGMGFKLMLAGVGIGILARTVRGLAGALFFLSGASTAVGILKTIAGLSGTLSSAAAGASLTGTATSMGSVFGTAFAASAGAAIAAGLLMALKELDPKGDLWGLTKPVDDFVQKLTGYSPSKDGLNFDTIKHALLPFTKGTDLLGGLLFPDGDPKAAKRGRDPGGYDMAGRAAYANSPAGIAEAAAARALADRANHRAGIDELPGKQRDDISLSARAVPRTLIDDLLSIIGGASSIAERSFPGKEADDVYTPPAPPQGNYWLDQIKGMLGSSDQSSGPQQVTVTNPPQPNVYNVSASVVVNEAANGAEVARQFASNLKTAIAGTHADMNHQAHA
jgi:TP901 family phage tail tape measure protein